MIENSEESIETAIHKGLKTFCQNIATEYAIQILQVDIDWTEVRTNNGSCRMAHLHEIRITTKSHGGNG